MLYRISPTSSKVGAQIAGVIARLALMSAGVDSEFPFTMVVDDPSGNSFVENPSAPNRDPALTVSEGKNRGSRGQGRVSSGYSIVCYREFMIQFVCVFLFLHF